MKRRAALVVIKVWVAGAWDGRREGAAGRVQGVPRARAHARRPPPPRRPRFRLSETGHTYSRTVQPCQSLGAR